MCEALCGPERAYYEPGRTRYLVRPWERHTQLHSEAAEAYERMLADHDPHQSTRKGAAE